MATEADLEAFGDDEAETAEALTLTQVAKINFQPATVLPPAGYTADTGLAFDVTRKFGWVRQDSLSSATHVPLDISPNTRKRNRTGIDPRLDTIVHMQYPSTTNPPNVGIPSAWEYVVPNGTYRVTVSVGDQPTYNSLHTIHVEGVTAIAGFQGSSTLEYKQATVDVTVSDGRLTIDAIGGTNTKLDYVDIFSVTTGPALALQNRDEVPFADRLVTSKLTDTSLSQQTHTKSTLRIKSTGTVTLKINQLTVTGPFRLNPAPTLPLSIAPGSATDVTVEIIATTGKVVTGNLAIASNAVGAATTNVQLAGARTAPEGSNEPTLVQIGEVFGYKTIIVGADQVLNHQGHVEAVGDEVLSPYWRARDPSRSIVVRQIAAYRGRTTPGAMSWHPKGSETLTLLISTAATNAQTLLPRMAGSTTTAAKASFSNTGVFGFKVDAEWSDPTKNDPAADLQKGCQLPCGHHVRFWPAKNRSGTVMTGTFIVAIDSHGINYDYQDNVFLISNITPD
jgi:hypothetical protein